MQNHTKTALAELHNKADDVLQKAYEAGVDDTYRWLFDKLSAMKVDKEILTKLMMDFVVENKGSYPSREGFANHYSEYLSKLGRKNL